MLGRLKNNKSLGVLLMLLTSTILIFGIAFYNLVKSRDGDSTSIPLISTRAEDDVYRKETVLNSNPSPTPTSVNPTFTPTPTDILVAQVSPSYNQDVSEAEDTPTFTSTKKPELPRAGNLTYSLVFIGLGLVILIVSFFV